VVTKTTSATISAVYGGPAKTAQLTINVAVDLIAIQRAEYSRSGLLRVNATSSQANAILKVYETATGVLIIQMKNKGGGNYSAQLSWPDNPNSITVRSSFGGSASKAVTLR